MNGKMLEKGAMFRDAIQQAAFFGMLDQKGSVYGTGWTLGYVCAIHDEEEGDEELMITVDVQEYNCSAKDVNGHPIGFHKGVMLAAVQNNPAGYYIVPQMYSDVIIQQDPATHDEYVMMYSHVSVFKLQVHDEITNTVTEYEDFVRTGDEGLVKDYDELKETGNKSTVTQTAMGFTESIVNPSGDELKTVRTAKDKTITVGDTTIFIDGNNVTVETSKNVKVKASTIYAEGNDVTVKGKQVVITGGNLTTKGVSNTDLRGPFNSIKMCPFSGAPHCGSKVMGT